MECPRCNAVDSFILLEGRYSCRVCNYEDQRRAEYAADDDCNFIDFTKDNTKLMTELRRSVRKSKRRVKTGDGTRKSRYRAVDEPLSRVPLALTGKRFRRRVQPGERQPPGDVLPRRHAQVEPWRRVSHRLSAFTQLLARTTRFLVKEKQAKEEIKPVAMVIFQRLLGSQGIAFSDAEWAAEAAERYTRELRRTKKRMVVVSTVDEQRAVLESQVATQNEQLRTGGGEDGMWSMLMSENVTENLQVAAPALPQGTRLKKKRRRVTELCVERIPTETAIGALVRGGIISLNVELLVAIAFLACALTGARVQMADLIRWYREARIALPPHFLHDLAKIKHCDDGKQVQMESCAYERHFNFYLHECASVLQRVMSATRLPRRSISIRLDEIVSAHLAALNLPRALMERALVVLARAHADTVILSIDRADEEGAYCNENTCAFGLEPGRVVHPLLSTAYRAPFVTFSPDTRAMAVILLVLRLTFGLRDDRVWQERRRSARFFDAGDWLRQLRARMGAYGGEEGEGVVRESMHEAPRDYEVEASMQLNRADLSVSHGKLTYRQIPRAAFPAGFEPLPRLDGLRYLYSDGLPFAEDGECLRASASKVAMRAPLVFHGERVREEIERDRERKRGEGAESGGGAGEEEEGMQWSEAVKLIGASFRDLDIEEASEPLEPASLSVRRERPEEDDGEGEEGGKCRGVAEEWRHLFPAAVNFELSKLPRLSVSCLVRADNADASTFMIGGGAGDMAFSLASAAPSLSRPHRFLLQAMSRLIVEAPSVLYAATAMLELRTLRYQSCLRRVQQLEGGGRVVVADCGVARSKQRPLQPVQLTLRRAADGARNIVHVVCEAKFNTREKRVNRRGAVEERAKAATAGTEETTGEIKDQEGEGRAEHSGEEEEGGEEEMTDEELEEEEEEEVGGGSGGDEEGGLEGTEGREEEGGGEGERASDDDEEVEILEGDEQSERPCERYKAAHEYYRPIVQTKFYLNFEYVWSILAMRLW